MLLCAKFLWVDRDSFDISVDIEDMKGERMKEKNRNVVGAVLIGFVLAVVPLIVSAKKYNIGLNTFPWFSNGDTSYDFFLYWKGQALILLCGVLALYVAVKLFLGKKDTFGDTDHRYLIPLAVYFVLCMLSTVFSGQRQTAIWGGYEQWEGMITLGTYVLLLLFSYCLVKGTTEITIVAQWLLAGAFVISLLSVRQAAGYDFFRTDMGKSAMNFMLDSKLNFTFNFEPGRVYATLYNPNYVGSYVALVLPVVLSFISLRKDVGAVVKSVFAGITVVFLVIMLLGSESVTGCIGVVASLFVFVVFMAARIKKHPKVFTGAVLICAGLMTAAVVWNRPVFEYGLQKITDPAPNNFLIQSMVSREGVLEMKTVDDQMLRLAVYIKDGSYQYEAADSEGNSAGIYRDEETGAMKFSDDRFQGIELSETSVEQEGKVLPAFVVETPATAKSYTVVLSKESPDQTVYQMYNPFQKLDGLREIKTFGFEKNQHFASRRGYIWSRTIPLLGKYIFLGSGPNTFIYEFPNDDYIGMKNVGYDGAVVTKPHNMFLQIFVQTGLLSLIAFLTLYVFYFVDCIRLYLCKTEYGKTERLGLGVALGTFGYLVTGLANDSTVAVAPLYWCLLGVGLAVNRFNRSGGKTYDKEQNIADGN